MNPDKDYKAEEFSRDDFVVVFGISTPNSSDCTTRIIATVLDVGEFDMFLKCHKTERTFRRSKEMCVKIPEPPRSPESIMQPKIGDLVLSYSSNRFTKPEKVLGILMELVDEPPYDLRAKILSGDKTHKVSFDSLIVMERRS